MTIPFAFDISHVQMGVKVKRGPMYTTKRNNFMANMNQILTHKTLNSLKWISFTLIFFYSGYLCLFLVNRYLSTLANQRKCCYKSKANKENEKKEQGKRRENNFLSWKKSGSRKSLFPCCFYDCISLCVLLISCVSTQCFLLVPFSRFLFFVLGIDVICYVQGARGYSVYVPLYMYFVLSLW